MCKLPAKAGTPRFDQLDPIQNQVLSSVFYCGFWAGLLLPERVSLILLIKDVPF